MDVAFSPVTYVGSFSALALQPDGRILLGGNFSSVDGISRQDVARLNSDGSVDTTFADPGIMGGSVSCLTATPQGKVVVCGSFTSINGYSRNGIARLNSDGTLDMTFNPGLGVQSGSIDAVVTQTNAEVLLAGSLHKVNGTNVASIVRLNADGGLDLGFNVGKVQTVPFTVW